MLPEIILSNDSRTTKTDAIAIMHDKTKIARGSKRFLPKIKTYTVIEFFLCYPHDQIIEIHKSIFCGHTNRSNSKIQTLTCILQGILGTRHESGQQRVTEQGKERDRKHRTSQLTLKVLAHVITFTASHRAWPAV